jgi:hypothetical protein
MQQEQIEYVTDVNVGEPFAAGERRPVSDLPTAYLTVPLLGGRE